MRLESDVVGARLALRWLIGGEWRFHWPRFVATMVAIAVGVALGFAVHLVNGSALASFDTAVRGVNGTADLSVRAASPLGFDENLYPRVLKSAGVSNASPVVSLEASTGAANFTLLGLDVIRAAAVSPGLVGRRTIGPDAEDDSIFQADALFLSRAALAATGAAIGDVIRLSANGRTAPFTVVGILPGVAEGQMLGTIDIAAAQWRFDRLGRLDRLDLKVRDRAEAEAALRGIVGGDALIGDTETEVAQGGALSRAYRVNLDMLALVALLTGAFLVFSAQSLSVARRLRVFALLRTLGLPRGGVVAVVAVEGLVIGALGSGLGLLAGFGLASLILRLFGGDLGAGYFSGTAGGVAFQPLAALVFFVLGVAAAMLGSVLPARAASRAAPAAALKNSGDVLDPRRPVPWKPSVILMGAGLVAALAPPLGGLPILGFLGMALLLAGGVAGVPWLARQILAPLARCRTRHVPQLLATRHVHGAPSQAATALCGIVASTALMIAMATMVTSFRVAVDDWLAEALSADLYLRTEGGLGFDAAAQARLAATPGLASIAFSRQLSVTLQPDRPPLVLIARPIEAENAGDTLVLIDRADASPGDVPPVWVSEPAARLYGWGIGQRIELPLGRGTSFAVAGIWRDYARQQGALVIRGADYARLTGDPVRDEAAAELSPGADAEKVGAAMLEALPADLRSSVSLAQPSTLRAYALDLFDRSFAVTYLLEAVAVLVGLAGVAATVSSQTISRVREFGMLRHLGVEKRQILAMLGLEGALLGTIGAVAGVLLGLSLSQVLIHVINPQSFNWTMSTRLPSGTILGVTAALIAAAALTAMLAGQRATACDAVLAVREDW